MIFWGGLIGWVIVDPITGAMYKLPETVDVDAMDEQTSLMNGKTVARVMTINQLTAEQRAQLIPLN